MERQNMPSPQLYQSTKPAVSRRCRCHRADRFAEVVKPLSLGTSPLKPSHFSGNASCPAESSLNSRGSYLILNYLSARDSE